MILSQFLAKKNHKVIQIVRREELIVMIILIEFFCAKHEGLQFKIYLWKCFAISQL